ncbi:hypothetical protein B0H15DRAFT_923429 [Mycena belliarum]|uniref:Uncharacterized protein n=1 Tax=Mycena belliarum TaxID=1033014 RepID=A0AAD6U173_9AGAR|nr:hypothetical protein B0H15DRAFT_923429 [Mycena belliae]
MSSSNDSFHVLPDGGGFLAEEEESALQIPLAAVPAALQRLDLPPDDEQVLLVFKNAAAGWKSSTNRPDEIGEADALFVSRDDWRSVCAVLLEHHAEEYAESEGAVGAGSVEDQDEYQDPSDAAEESDSDEYTEEPSTSRRRARATRRARSSSSSPSPISTPKKLTSRQTKACLETYALFFPSASESELPQQRLLIKDVQRVSTLIGDKLKGDEIIEMLAEFSTSPDKSMSFADFGSMMVAAKMA